MATGADSSEVTDYEPTDDSHGYRTTQNQPSIGFAMNTISAGGNINFTISAAGVNGNRFDSIAGRY
jgi:thiamine pyrophosphokinase